MHRPSSDSVLKGQMQQTFFLLFQKIYSCLHDSHELLTSADSGEMYEKQMKRKLFLFSIFAAEVVSKIRRTPPVGLNVDAFDMFYRALRF